MTVWVCVCVHVYSHVLMSWGGRRGGNSVGSISEALSPAARVQCILPRG